jgi:hypothetical protein
MSLAIIIEATMTGGAMKEAIGITVMPGTITDMTGIITDMTGIITASKDLIVWTRIFTTGRIFMIITGGNEFCCSL